MVERHVELVKLRKALRVLLGDVQNGKIPPHVAAVVLRSIHEKAPLPLEEVPVGEWIRSVKDEGQELSSALVVFFIDIIIGTMNVADAFQIIKDTHEHIDAARLRIMQSPVNALGFERQQLRFLEEGGFTTLEALLLAGTEGLFRTKPRASFVQGIIKRVDKIPLCSFRPSKS